MPISEKRELETIGFCGDGDQVDAYLAIERHFKVEIDDTNCGAWRTAGDVFDTLLAAIPVEQRPTQKNWSEFAAIMCEETEADAARLGRNTLLLALPLSLIVSRWLRKVLSRGP